MFNSIQIGYKQAASLWWYIDISKRSSSAILGLQKIVALTSLSPAFKPKAEIPDGGIFGYVCLSFSHLSDKEPGRYQVKREDLKILWLMKRNIRCLNEHIAGKPGSAESFVWRSVEFRSAMNDLAIPESGVEFFTSFVRSAEDVWNQVLEEAKSHLVERVGHSEKSRSLVLIIDCEF